MARNSRNRDLYDARLQSAKLTDSTSYMKLLLASPFKKHVKEAKSLLDTMEKVQQMQELLKEKEQADAV